MALERMTELRVGLFIFIGGMVAIFFVFAISGEQATFGRSYRLQGSFESVAGLRTGATVQVAGMTAGSVEAMSFSDDPKSPLVAVTLRLQRSFQDRVREDSVATIETQGLLGDKLVAISVGTPESPSLPDSGVIRTRETTTIFGMTEKVNSAVTNIDEITASLNRLFKDSKDETKRGDLMATVASLRKTVEEVERGDGVLHALIFEPRGKEIVTNLAETTKSAREISRGIAEGEGTAGRLLRDPALYEDLRVLMGRASRSKLLKAVIRATLEQNEKQTLQR